MRVMGKGRQKPCPLCGRKFMGEWGGPKGEVLYVHSRVVREGPGGVPTGRLEGCMLYEGAVIRGVRFGRLPESQP